MVSKYLQIDFRLFSRATHPIHMKTQVQSVYDLVCVIRRILFFSSNTTWPGAEVRGHTQAGEGGQAEFGEGEECRQLGGSENMPEPSERASLSDGPLNP